MAQLNPNFEIDFNDINSYEQIQLINDTQLAKENLLMHKAYKEPAEDEIIRNQFSSFTFVDFCPKLFTVNAATDSRASSRPASSASSRAKQATDCDVNDEAEIPTQSRRQSRSSGGRMLRHQNYELETFSDLFDRINVWLKLNKDWRVVSMETLIFDCTTQFNHLKSSIHAGHLPRNMRGLRLYLSPSKSRFAGHQKIGCINVIPRKLAGHYKLPGGSAQATSDSPPPLVYETLEQILARLNELLLTRPIEGRILSLETLTLPIVNGYVNTETNYFMDSRLNLLDQRIYTHAREQQQQQPGGGIPAAAPTAPSAPVASSTGPRPRQPQHAHGLADVLRVYYEFGPMVCGLVNLLDFLPHFHRQASSAQASGEAAANDDETSVESGGVDQANSMEIDASETLTRLVRRSLAWFEEERKRTLRETASEGASSGLIETNLSDDDKTSNVATRELARAQLAAGQQINLKLCNLQIHSKVLLKSQLAAVTPQNAAQLIETGRMFHEPPREPIACKRCGLSSDNQSLREWCKHLLDLNQPYKLKFVRLAYVVPVYNKHVASRLLSLQRPQVNPNDKSSVCDNETEVLSYVSPEAPIEEEQEEIEQLEDEEEEEEEDDEVPHASSTTTSSSSSSHDGDLADDLHVLEGILSASASHQLDMEELAKEASLAIVRATNERQRANELAHQMGDESATTASEAEHEQGSASGLIGQLTYRLFAPCQLVNSSSCFSINPINSSSPLSRRGSVNLSSAAAVATAAVTTATSLSSENATPSSLLLPPATQTTAPSNSLGGHLSESTASINGGAHHLLGAPNQTSHHHHQVISFGAFFPALSHEIITTTSSPFNLIGGGGGVGSGMSNANSMGGSGHSFTTNEFEPVEAIRRRMEVYVTTNSMKVLAGETLVVNLSDQLSCLSTAIEQTIVKMSLVPPAAAQASAQAPATPSTWVSVYILYAAVDEPHLPGQLLEQQRMREQLALIDELDESGEDGGQQQDDKKLEVAAPEAETSSRLDETKSMTHGQDNMVPVFDDDFKSVSTFELATAGAAVATPSAQPTQSSSSNKVAKSIVRSAPTLSSEATPAALTTAAAALNQPDGSIRVELERELGSGAPASSSPYNSAYDRTVALPTQPDDHLNDYLEPVDFNLNPRQLADSLGFEQLDLNTEGDTAAATTTTAAALDLYCATGACQHEPISLTSVSIQAAQRQMRLRQARANGGSAMVGGNRQRPLVAAGGKVKGRVAKSTKKDKNVRGRSDSHHCALI